MLIEAILFLIGLAFLIKGADIVTDHASKLATRVGVSQLVIGTTIVAFSTSLPEFAVSILSAISSTADIATGTIIGSNITNIGLILGLSALASPLVIGKNYIKEAYVMLAFTLTVSLFLVTGLYWLTGAILIICTVVYMKWLLKRKSSNINKSESRDGLKPAHTKPIIHLLLIALGSASIVIGANILLTSSINIARASGISRIVIAMIAIALGTSLPELATSLVAAIKKMRGISVGNIIGSNIFNIAILSSAAILKPVPVTRHVVFMDIPIMIILTCFLLLVMRNKHKITRIEGMLLLAVYFIFLFVQFL